MKDVANDTPYKKKEDRFKLIQFREKCVVFCWLDQRSNLN